MANLVPLHIDKQTGKIVAKGGAGGPNFATKGFLYEQILPSDTWIIPHNCDSDQLIAQVYDNTGMFVLPDEIEIVDTNTVIIRFTSPQEGTGHIAFFKT